MEDDRSTVDVATPPLARETDSVRRERSILKWVAGFCAIGGLALGLGVGLTLGALSARDRGHDRESMREREAYWGVTAPMPPMPPPPPMVAIPGMPDPADMDAYHGYVMDGDRDCRTFVVGQHHRIIVQNYGPGCDAHPGHDSDGDTDSDAPKKRRPAP